MSYYKQVNGPLRASHSTPSLIISSTEDLKTQTSNLKFENEEHLGKRNIKINSQLGVDTIKKANQLNLKVSSALRKAHNLYNAGQYKDSLILCEEIYEANAYRTDNLLMLGSIHFQLRNFSESIFYNQQCVRVDPRFAEAYSNLGNALKELGDLESSVQFYLKAIKIKPRFGDAYNNLACVYMQLGQVEEAMETFRMAITLNPRLIEAHNNLGNLYKALSDFDEAKKCYLEAIKIKPDFAIAWSNLAGVFKDEGQYKIAIAYYKETLRLCSEFADAHSNLGNAQKSAGYLDEAICCYQTAIKLRPDFAVAHGNLGCCFFEKEMFDEALKSLKYAIQLEPTYPDAYNNLGNVLHHIGLYEESIRCYRATLRLKPDHPHAYNNLGRALQRRGLIQEAVHCYITAIRLMPNFPAAHCNLGAIFNDQGKFDQALSHYREAISLDAAFVEAYCNMGCVLSCLQKYSEAEQYFLKAVELRPNSPEVYVNLGILLLANGRLIEAMDAVTHALKLKPHYPEALANLTFVKMMLCEWTSIEVDQDQLVTLLSSQLTVHENQSDLYNTAPCVTPFQALSLPISMAEHQKLASRYSHQAKLGAYLLDCTRIYLQKPTTARLKVGYVSSNFGNHPIGHLVQSVFGFHDRSKFEVYCYSLSPHEDSKWRTKIYQESDLFRDISSLYVGDICQLIRNDRIHILINLDGFTFGNVGRIFAAHPAPIQISFLGYSGTTGSDYIEYLIADNFVMSKEYRMYYAEKIIYLPHSFCVNDHKQSARHLLDSPVISRTQFGISEDKFVFCNFSQPRKIDKRIFQVWMNILKRVPNSLLWLINYNDRACSNLTKEAKLLGVRSEQLVFSPVLPREEHLKRCVLADLCLDTPNNSKSSSCDLLWSATPIITCPGDKMNQRLTSSLLHSCGLKNLIVSTYTMYEELAVTLAIDQNQLYGMRKHLELVRDASPAFDTLRWTMNFEKSLAAIWNRREKGGQLDDLVVGDDGPTPQNYEL